VDPGFQDKIPQHNFFFRIKRERETKEVFVKENNFLEACQQKHGYVIGNKYLSATTEIEAESNSSIKVSAHACTPKLPAEQPLNNMSSNS
jgi:hypothetical protein